MLKKRALRFSFLAFGYFKNLGVVGRFNAKSKWRIANSLFFKV